MSCDAALAEMENKVPTMHHGSDISENYPFEERYFIINKRLLCFFGLWPFLSFRKRFVRVFFLLVFTITIFIPLMLKVLSSFQNINTLIEMFPPMVVNCGVTVKTINFVCYSKEIRLLLNETRENWKYSRQDLPELKILQEFGEKGRVATIGYMIIINISIALFIAMPMVTIVQDWIVPLNESRPHLVLIPTDYKVDPEEYFYLIYFHGSAGIALCLQIYIANDTFYMIMSQHACGMIEILRYRLENIAGEDETPNIELNSYYQKNVHYRSIVVCIKTHKRIIENVIVHYDTSAKKLFPTSVSLQHEPKASVAIRQVEKKFLARVSHEILFDECEKCDLSHTKPLSGIKLFLELFLWKRFIKLLESTCEWILVAAVCLTVICISTTGAQTVSGDIPTEDIVRFSIFMFGQVGHLFCNTLPGHWIMDSSSLIRDSAYNSRWHLISPKSRKLLVLLLRRCTEPCIITAGKIYVMSMENFSAVLKTSASYFTLLTSVQ